MPQSFISSRAFAIWGYAVCIQALREHNSQGIRDISKITFSKIDTFKQQNSNQKTPKPKTLLSKGTFRSVRTPLTCTLKVNLIVTQLTAGRRFGVVELLFGTTSYTQTYTVSFVSVVRRNVIQPSISIFLNPSTQWIVSWNVFSIHVNISP